MKSLKLSNLLNNLVGVTCLYLLFFATASSAEAATLNVSPSTGVYTVGSPFTVRVVLNTQGAPINAAEGVLSYDPKKLRVNSISQAGSIFNLWTIEPEFSNSSGRINFGGGSPRGYTGSAGTIISVSMSPLTAGAAKLTFTSGSALAADGQGTNVLAGMSSGSYTIAAQSTAPEPEQIIEYVAPANTPTAPKVISSTHPDTQTWYQDTTAQLSWSVPSGITAVRTGLTNSPSSVPTVVYDPPISQRTLSDLEQGVQYFHLQFKNENGWGKVSHYRLAVDSNKPTDFTIELVDPDSVGNPQPSLKFIVKDQTSDIDRYLIQIDGAEEAIEFVDTSSEGLYQLPTLDPGRHTVVVEAFDQAGNSIVSSFAFDVASFEKPVFTNYPQRLSAGVTPVITGVTRPQAEVHVQVSQVGATTNPDNYVLSSDEQGNFTFIPDGPFTSGTYDLSAYAVDQFGAQSEHSDVVRMIVAEPGYITVGTMLVSALSLIVSLLALVFVLFLGGLYFWRRLRYIIGYVTRETKEAEAVVTTTFSRLRHMVDAHAATLAASRKTKKLTKAESELIEALRTELAEAERRVSKEVSDVDNVM